MSIINLSIIIKGDLVKLTSTSLVVHVAHGNSKEKDSKNARCVILHLLRHLQAPSKPRTAHQHQTSSTACHGQLCFR